VKDRLIGSILIGGTVCSMSRVRDEAAGYVEMKMSPETKPPHISRTESTLTDMEENARVGRHAFISHFEAEDNEAFNYGSEGYQKYGSVSSYLSDQDSLAATLGRRYPAETTVGQRLALGSPSVIDEKDEDGKGMADSPSVFKSGGGRLSSAELIQQVNFKHMDWNEEFQTIQTEYQRVFFEKSPVVNVNAMKKELALRLSRLAKDFNFYAQTYSRVIISEYFIDESDPRRTIKSITNMLRGVAGGAKFSAYGMLFKFALGPNSRRLYGNDVNAMKSANLELLGCTEVCDSLVSRIRCPLMTLVTFRYPFSQLVFSL
jgi:hypothetical protein